LWSSERLWGWYQWMRVEGVCWRSTHIATVHVVYPSNSVRPHDFPFTLSLSFYGLLVYNQECLLYFLFPQFLVLRLRFVFRTFVGFHSTHVHYTTSC
jgi:hypothetical protein